jgi:hypothetical protein
MTERMFDIAGFSTQHGKRKVRFANGKVEVRAKVLERNEHTDIDLRVLPNPMTKTEAMAFLGVKDDDAEAPKGVQAAAAKAKRPAKAAEVLELAKLMGKTDTVAAATDEEPVAA